MPRRRCREARTPRNGHATRSNGRGPRMPKPQRPEARPPPSDDVAKSNETRAMAAKGPTPQGAAPSQRPRDKVRQEGAAAAKAAKRGPLTAATRRGPTRQGADAARHGPLAVVMSEFRREGGADTQRHHCRKARPPRRGYAMGSNGTGPRNAKAPMPQDAALAQPRVSWLSGAAAALRVTIQPTTNLAAGRHAAAQAQDATAFAAKHRSPILVPRSLPQSRPRPLRPLRQWAGRQPPRLSAGRPLRRRPDRLPPAAMVEGGRGGNRAHRHRGRILIISLFVFLILTL